MENRNLAELATLWGELGPKGRLMFLEIGRRLAKGHKQYGDFKTRKWTREALEEALDMAVYLSAELMLDPPPSSRKKASSRPAHKSVRKASSQKRARTSSSGRRR